jgi:hypothetical protein
VLSILILFPTVVFPQEPRSNFYTGISVRTGLNLPLYDAIDYLTDDDIVGADMFIGIRSNGKDYWDEIFNFPGTGAGYSFRTLGNNEVFGYAHAFYAFMDLPLLLRKRKLSADIRISAGTAYISSKFDAEDNPLNRAIGSNFNIFLGAGINARYRFSGKFETFIGASTGHFSNGKTRSPNLGLNTGTVSAGIFYFFYRESFTRDIPAAPVPERKIIQSVEFSAGPKVFDNLSGTRYLSSSLLYSAERYVKHWGRAGIGGGLFYDGSIREGLNLGDDGGIHVSLFRVGLHASWMFRYRNILAGIQAGHYLYSKYKVNTHFYNRLSVRYMLTGNIYTAIAVRSHLGKADSMEYGFGYTW